MSLSRQLWISSILFIALTLFGGFTYSFLGTRNYLISQLTQKNIDNATSLALAMTAQASDKTLLSLYLNAQFDNGHYAFIQFQDASGNIILSKTQLNTDDRAPEWLIRWAQLDIPAGTALVSNGWQQAGTLTLKSHEGFAYSLLWQTLKRLTAYYLIIMAAGALLIYAMIKRLLAPLNLAVDHANALGEKRFVTSGIPKTPEFKKIIKSLNQLSHHVQTMLGDEAKKLEDIKLNSAADRVTGVMSREITLEKVQALMTQSTANANGDLLLIRIKDMLQLNEEFGRQRVDALLQAMANKIQDFLKQPDYSAGFVGKLNGSDFLLTLPAVIIDDLKQREQLIHELHAICKELMGSDTLLVVATTEYQTSDMISQLLTRLDSALHDMSDSVLIHYVDKAKTEYSEFSDNEWRGILESALENQRFCLSEFPVYSNTEKLIRKEAPVKLNYESDRQIPASVFMTYVQHLNLSEQLDWCVLKLALTRIREDNATTSIHLSEAFLKDSGAVKELVQAIDMYQEESPKLCLEIAEHHVFHYFEGFRNICLALQGTNTKIGIAHAGQKIKQLGALHDLGVNYIKIESAMIRNLNDNISYQTYLRGVCTIAHSIGIQVFAEGVVSEEEWDCIKQLGFEGATGPYFNFPE